MGLGAFLRRLERRVARLNDRIAPTALAADAATGVPSQPIDPAAVVAGLGEIERRGEAGADSQQRSTD